MTKIVINLNYEIKYCTTDKSVTSNKYEVIFFNSEEELLNAIKPTLFVGDDLQSVVLKCEELKLIAFVKSKINLTSVASTLSFQTFYFYVDKLNDEGKQRFQSAITDLLKAENDYLNQIPLTLSQSTTDTFNWVFNMMPQHEQDEIIREFKNRKIVNPDAPFVKLIDTNGDK